MKEFVESSGKKSVVLVLQVHKYVPNHVTAFMKIVAGLRGKITSKASELPRLQ